MRVHERVAQAVVYLVTNLVNGKLGLPGRRPRLKLDSVRPRQQRPKLKWLLLRKLDANGKAERDSVNKAAVMSFCSVLAVSSYAAASEPVACNSPDQCVAKPDLDTFLIVLREKKCLQAEKPKFDLDPITITVDKEGRVFYSGAAPSPYTVRMAWCGYSAEAKGKVHLTAAMNQPSLWGFRFRPKAYISLLPTEPLQTQGLDFGDIWDAGAMVDFFHYDWLNVNAAVGFRSFGGGLGVDLTQNFGVYAGYANTWATWHSNVNLGVWFSFWNP